MDWSVLVQAWPYLAVAVVGIWWAAPMLPGLFARVKKQIPSAPAEDDNSAKVEAIRQLQGLRDYGKEQIVCPKRKEEWAQYVAEMAAIGEWTGCEIAETKTKSR